MSQINKMEKKTVAIVVPLSNREYLTPEEQISLRHLESYLGSYDKYFVMPKDLEFDRAGFKIMRFSKQFFGSLDAHTKLSFYPKFYESFSDYKYMLMYHLDSLIFSDQLIQWCETDVDYIGAPWIKSEDSPWVKTPKVGNSGFSLRKIESFLKVIYSSRYMVEPSKYWEKFCASRSRFNQLVNLPRKYVKYLRAFNSARWHMRRYRRNDDYFWSNEARKYFPAFEVASLDTALSFAFEVAPRLCFELNSRKLPFGCHAWHRYDREFWEPYLLK